MRQVVIPSQNVVTRFARDSWALMISPLLHLILGSSKFIYDASSCCRSVRWLTRMRQLLSHPSAGRIVCPRWPLHRADSRFSMSCNGCKAEFGLFKKSRRCGSCKEPFCKQCSRGFLLLDNPDIQLGVQVDPHDPVPVCKECFKKVTAPPLICPPRSLL